MRKPISYLSLFCLRKTNNGVQPQLGEYSPNPQSLLKDSRTGGCYEKELALKKI